MEHVFLSRKPSPGIINSLVSKKCLAKFIFPMDRCTYLLQNGFVDIYKNLGAFRPLPKISAAETLVKVKDAFAVFPPDPNISINTRLLNQAQLVPIIPSEDRFELPGTPRSLLLILSAKHSGDYTDFIVTTRVKRKIEYVNYNKQNIDGNGLQHSGDQLHEQMNTHQIKVNGDQVQQAVLVANVYRRANPLTSNPDVFLTIMDPEDLSTVYVVVSRPHLATSIQAVMGVLECDSTFNWSFRHVDHIQCKNGTCESIPSTVIENFVSTL